MLVYVMLGGTGVFGFICAVQIAFREHARGRDVFWYLIACGVAAGIVRQAVAYRKRRADKAKV